MRTYDPQDAAMPFAANGWFKATASSGNGTECVEVNFGVVGLVGLRDSKQPHTATFVFTIGEWHAFLDGAKDGGFDVPW